MLYFRKMEDVTRFLKEMAAAFDDIGRRASVGKENEVAKGILNAYLRLLYYAQVDVGHKVLSDAVLDHVAAMYGTTPPPIVSKVIFRIVTTEFERAEKVLEHKPR